MDIVFLHGLEVEAVIGVFDWERHTTQRLYIDLDMGTDVRRAAATDRIEDALDYKEVANRVRQWVESREAQLVETLAEGIASLLVEEMGVSWVRVKVNKRGAITGAGDVGVVIERGSEG